MNKQLLILFRIKKFFRSIGRVDQRYTRSAILINPVEYFIAFKFEAKIRFQNKSCMIWRRTNKFIFENINFHTFFQMELHAFLHKLVPFVLHIKVLR